MLLAGRRVRHHDTETRTPNPLVRYLLEAARNWTAAAATSTADTGSIMSTFSSTLSGKLNILQRQHASQDNVAIEIRGITAYYVSVIVGVLLIR